MPVKRSRVSSSSSLLAMPAAASFSQVKVMKAEPSAQPSRPRFWSSVSPEIFGVPNKTKIGGFLERCHYCKKLIAEDSEIFMYSNLCAFCSAECRDFQITLDQSAEKQPENSKENLVLQQGVYK